jgi:hypothetical protein
MAALCILAYRLPEGTFLWRRIMLDAVVSAIACAKYLKCETEQMTYLGLVQLFQNSATRRLESWPQLAGA